MTTVEALHEVGQVVVRGVAQHPERAGAPFERVDRRDGLDAVGDRAHRQFGVLAQGERGVGRREPPGSAGEQPHAQLVLQARDQLGDRRLGRVEFDSRRGERSELHRGEECLELGDGHEPMVNPVVCIVSTGLVRYQSAAYRFGMRYSPALLQSLEGSFRHLKTPLIDAPAAQRDPAVIETVSAMLSDIQQRGLDAVLDYARKLDNYQGGDIELSAEQIATSGDRLPADLRAAIELGSARTKAFAAEQRAHLTDFETELVPGLITGARYIPVSRVGAYLPAGRFPLTASAFMTVGVAKAAGVPTVIACTPPQPHGGANDAVVYAAHLSGVDRVFVLGGVQALAAMAYGLLGELPDRHARRRRQRLRRRGEAPALRRRRDRSARRPLRGRGDLGRDRRPRDRRRRPARPGRARSQLARRARHDLGRARPRRHRSGRASARRAVHRADRRARRGATTARSPSRRTARPPSR